LSFKKFFVPSQCVKKNNEYGWINHHIAGGRMVNFKNNKILFSTGALQYFKHPQDKNSPLGKILSIDKNTANWKIISMGHRNVQGLKYDFKKDIIFSTEHGPTGGDEFNINFNPNSNDVKNYGWPISSYGEHGSYKAIKDPKELKLRYDKAPLNKSHKKYGFIEPIKYYVPSIGITEIEMIPKKFNKNFDNDFFIASMGTNKEEGDLSIHHIKLDKEFKKILKEDIIFIGERIRDFKYLEDINKIVLFIENSPGIGVLSHSTN
jgi:glucose/arabinose dehydrogenase